MNSRRQSALWLTLILLCAACGGVCGDGVVDPGEACDAAGDGCDASCHLTGVAAWTVTRGEPSRTTRAIDVAVDANGQIVVLGTTWPGSDANANVAGWLLALDAAGEERWQVDVPAPPDDTLFPARVVIGADASIYYQSDGLIRFDASGAQTWVLPDDPGSAVTAIAVTGDAVFVASQEFTGQTPVKLGRYDPDSNELEWASVVSDDAPLGFATAIAVAGDTVMAVGRVDAERWDEFGFSCVAAATGVYVPCLTDRFAFVADELGVLRSGDLVMVHTADDVPLFLRRFTRAGEVRWDTQLTPEGVIQDLVIGPDDTIVVAGRGLRTFTSAGAPVWKSEYPQSDPEGLVSATGVAFGPGFLVAVGTEVAQTTVSAWIRKYGD